MNQASDIQRRGDAVISMQLEMGDFLLADDDQLSHHRRFVDVNTHVSVMRTVIKSSWR